MNMNQNQNQIAPTDGSTEKKQIRKRRILDIIAFVLCFGVAFGVWAYVLQTENGNYEHTFSKVVVVLEGTEDLKERHNLSLISGYDTEVSITVKGPRSEIMKCTAEDIFAHVTLDSITKAGRHMLDVSVDNLPGSIKLESVSPSKIGVFADENAEKNIDISVKLLYNVSNELTIGEPEPEITSVLVSGPKTVLDTIQSAQIKCDLGTVTASVNVKAAITLCDADGNEVKNPYVRTDVSETTVKVKVTAEKTVPLQASYTADDMDRYKYQIEFMPETVKVVGEPKKIAEMESVEVTIGKITNSAGGSVTTENNLLLPENVKLVDQDLKTVKYKVTKTLIEENSES